jgi:(p)ppGpp synthase/HD superfamily hydrolase
MDTDSPLLSARFNEALDFAVSLHSRQIRKGSRVPYVSHLLAVCALVIEDGGTEDEAIAALLHDAVEDQGGEPVLEEIHRRFGPKVAEIVHSCSDSSAKPKPPWRQRKEGYLAHLREASPEARRVSCADKIHNARSILTDYRRTGDTVWTRFTAGRDETIWYYRSVVRTLREVGGSPMVEELARLVAELEWAVYQPRTSELL